MTRYIGTSGNGFAKPATHRSQGQLRFLALALALATAVSFAGDDTALNGSIPDEIKQILSKPRYDKSIWGLRVVDLDSGKVVYELNSDRQLLIGSVRKLFSVGLALEALGPVYVFRTPVYTQGRVHHGHVLDGDLVLVASGDLAMGGRTNADGSYAISDLDHNEANALGNAILTAPDPLAGSDSAIAMGFLTTSIDDAVLLCSGVVRAKLPLPPDGPGQVNHGRSRRHPKIRGDSRRRCGWLFPADG
jgi:D-alanyl-D-alanine carboxypeptidase